MTRTTPQYIYADANSKLFESTLGGTAVRVGSRLFIDGEYTFALQQTGQSSLSTPPTVLLPHLQLLLL